MQGENEIAQHKLNLGAVEKKTKIFAVPTSCECETVIFIYTDCE